MSELVTVTKTVTSECQQSLDCENDCNNFYLSQGIDLSRNTTMECRYKCLTLKNC